MCGEKKISDFFHSSFLFSEFPSDQKNRTSVVVELTVTLKDTEGNQEVENFRRRTDEVEAVDTQLLFTSFFAILRIECLYSNA